MHQTKDNSYAFLLMMNVLLNLVCLFVSFVQIVQHVAKSETQIKINANANGLPQRYANTVRHVPSKLCKFTNKTRNTSIEYKICRKKYNTIQRTKRHISHCTNSGKVHARRDCKNHRIIFKRKQPQKIPNKRKCTSITSTAFATSSASASVTASTTHNNSNLLSQTPAAGAVATITLSLSATVNSNFNIARSASNNSILSLATTNASSVISIPASVVKPLAARVPALASRPTCHKH